MASLVLEEIVIPLRAFSVELSVRVFGSNPGDGML